MYLKFSAWAWVHVSLFIWYESEEVCLLTDGMVSYVSRNLNKKKKNITSFKNPVESESKILYAKLVLFQNYE